MISYCLYFPLGICWKGEMTDIEAEECCNSQPQGEND